MTLKLNQNNIIYLKNQVESNQIKSSQVKSNEICLGISRKVKLI
jgi:hypothetical protein